MADDKNNIANVPTATLENEYVAALLAEIERLRAAGDALSSFIHVYMPHVGWTTADRDTAAAVLDKWQEARRG